MKTVSQRAVGRLLSAMRDRDVVSGGAFFLLGLGVVSESRNYPVGSLAQMGPGYFPILIGCLLSVLGFLIAFGKRAGSKDPHDSGQSTRWRRSIFITLALLSFVVAGRFGGLIPASFLVVFIAAIGDSRNSLKTAFSLALVMTVLAVVVFSWFLHLQFPLFRWGT